MSNNTLIQEIKDSFITGIQYLECISFCMNKCWINRRKCAEYNVDTPSEIFGTLKRILSMSPCLPGEEKIHRRIARKGIGNCGTDYFQRAVVWYKGALAALYF